MSPAAMTRKQQMHDAMPHNDGAFYFPQGMIGFSDAHEYGLIYEGVGKIACLQSIDHPEAAFLLTPWDEPRLGPPPELNREQIQCIDAEDAENVLWMLVLNPFADKQWVTANLKAPVAVNTEKRIGLQCIRSEPELELRFHWMPQPA
ncbi:flagellar assembly protein FliW [Mariprofundus ferrooxydans]|uniref:flagellar assembly protein FliW n=1 Tax=Mariprofundus ferrooxydans TaxID=314344 RepID=UPI001E6516CF|nr:flagellar assembly protein FliW [Mariprofundus ferrooxydans]